MSTSAFTLAISSSCFLIVFDTCLTVALGGAVILFLIAIDCVATATLGVRSIPLLASILSTILAAITSDESVSAAVSISSTSNSSPLHILIIKSLNLFDIFLESLSSILEKLILKYLESPINTISLSPNIFLSLLVSFLNINQ